MTATPLQAIVAQSAAIHPDWTPEMHLSYLVNDAFAIDLDPADDRYRGALLESITILLASPEHAARVAALLETVR